MKIAIITGWDIECGIALYAENLVSEWRNAGHEVVILAETCDEWAQRREVSSSDVVRCWTRDTEFRRLLETIRHIPDIDVVCIQHEMSYVSLPHLWMQLITGIRAMGIPVVVTYHTYPFNTHPVTEVREMDGVVVLNHHAAKTMVERGWPEAKVFHVPHAALLPISPYLGRNPTGKIVTWGFLTSHKGYSGVMDAVQPLLPDYPSMRLTIYGAWVRASKGHQEHYLERELKPEIATRGLSGRVGVLTGFPHQSVLQDMIADHDISVLYYGINNTGYASSGCLQTAFSAGRPVITSNARHFDVLPEYADAVLRAKNPDEIRAHIKRLLDDPQYYAEMTMRVRLVAEERHQEHMAYEYIDVFQKVIEQFETPPAVVSTCPLSVVIATKNRKDCLKSAIESCADAPVEIIVVDDNSTDDTEAMVRADFPQVKYIRIPFDKGQSYARNVGIREAQGRYIKFLDDDDIHLDCWFDTLQDEIADGYEVISLGCMRVLSNGGVERIRDFQYTSQLCVSKSAILVVEGFDQNLNWREEQHLVKRLDDAAYKAHYNDRICVIKSSAARRGHIIPKDVYETGRTTTRARTGGAF